MMRRWARRAVTGYARRVNDPLIGVMEWLASRWYRIAVLAVLDVAMIVSVLRWVRR